MSDDNGAFARRTVAVYRSTWLPPSETFVRDHVLKMPRYETVPLTSRRHPRPLDVPGKAAVVAGPTGPLARVTARHRTPRLHDRVSTIALTRALERLEPDLVHAHFGPDGARILPACRRLGVPLVVTFHGYDVTTFPEVLRRSPEGRLLLESWDGLMEHSAALVTVSGYLRDRLLERGADPARLHVLACGVETPSRITPLPAEARVLFVGRLVEKKGVGDLLAALAALGRRVPLDIVGDGPLRPALEEQAVAAGVDVTFHGMCDSRAVEAFMERATVVAMPSRRAATGDTEGLPVTALEAGARGRVVVGYAHSGIAEAVDDGRTGLLAAEGDVAGLSDRLRQALDDPALVARLGAAAAERVRASYEVGDILARMADLYDGVLAPTTSLDVR